MEQKGYNKEFEIIIYLLNQKSHIREISKKLSLNHMNVKRILDRLYDQRIVDFEESGKNKTFYLKNNLETRNKILSAELYKQTKTLSQNPFLRPVFNKIISNKKIKLALLFGSFAKGINNKKSDVDIYIETESLELKKEVEKINSRIDVKTGKFDKDSPLSREIIENHVVIKGVEKYYDKTQEASFQKR